MSKAVVGIDISKAKFDVALLLNTKFKHKKFENNLAGFAEFTTWLNSFEATSCHIAMEATGIYGDALAIFLCEAGYTVSVINPAQIKKFGESELRRTKTDKSDAKLIARFCMEKTPATWHPAPAHIRELQALVRRLEALQDMFQQESNRLEGANEIVLSSIEAIRTRLLQEIKEVKEKIKQHIDKNPDLRDKKKLLETIPGVGENTIAQVLAFIEIENFPSAKKLATFLGLTPEEHSSGTSIRKQARLSKKGNAKLRKALYMPALVAKRYNPLIKETCERLKNRGKCNMLILGAAMRKLAHIIYGVLKSGKAFDSSLAINNA